MVPREHAYVTATTVLESLIGVETLQNFRNHCDITGISCDLLGSVTARGIWPVSKTSSFIQGERKEHNVTIESDSEMFDLSLRHLMCECADANMPLSVEELSQLAKHVLEHLTLQTQTNNTFIRHLPPSPSKNHILANIF
jgi:hypothetical protein